MILTLAAMFGLGALRAAVTRERWWKTALETVALGAVVAGTAYAAGALAAAVAAGAFA